MPKSKSDNSPQRLPFEPKKAKPKPVKQPPGSKGEAGTATTTTATKSRTTAPKGKRSNTGIPEVVSRRMASRMLVFCGVPSLMGLLSFPLSYFAVTKHWLELPTWVVVIVSLGLMGLGALGLSYGVLSASWEEAESGSWLGWQEFRVNFGRVTEGWRNRNQQKSS